MQEKLINERRDWKAQVFPYDYYLPDGSAECQYCLTDKQAELLRGLVAPVAWRTRWWSDSDAPIDLAVIEEYRADLIRRLMMSCCGDEIPVQFRYTEDGTLQKSEDGGTVWVDAPEFDPRINSPQFPPIAGEDGDDKKCIAATGAADLIKQQVGDQLTDDMSRYTLSQLLSDWTGTVINSGGNIFQALVTIATNSIFALVIATLRPALTDTVYGILKCILYCNMALDATINAAQWSQIRSDITAQIGGIAGIFLEHLVYLLGTGGMTNLIRAGGASTGDCSDCDCNNGCDTNWSVYVGSGDYFGEIISQDGSTIHARTTNINTNNVWYIYLVTSDVNDCCYINSMEIVTGDPVLNASACGNAIGTGITNPLGPGCFNQLQPQTASGPFEVIFHIAPCP